MNIASYTKILKQSLFDIADPRVAEGQEAYMKHQFAFIGVKAPQWLAIVKSHMKEHGLLHGKELRQFVEGCYDEGYRELIYVACEISQCAQPKEDVQFIKLLEWMITHQSWWDTVDWLAKVAGTHMMQHPQLFKTIPDRWIASSQMWLQRSAIIYQLMYKEKTDFPRLCSYIQRVGNTNEFFIQKACGWALRQYSRTNPKAVIKFVKENPQLRNLTKREALRLINK